MDDRPHITLMIPVDTIPDLIGPDGVTIQTIVKEIGVTIALDEDGRLSITSDDAEKCRRAADRIRQAAGLREM